MSELIERAKLTDEEINDLDYSFTETRNLCDAAVAKALWVVVDWLFELAPPPLATLLKEDLEWKGIERPKKEVSVES